MDDEKRATVVEDMIRSARKVSELFSRRSEFCRESVQGGHAP